MQSKQAGQTDGFYHAMNNSLGCATGYAMTAMQKKPYDRPVCLFGLDKMMRKCEDLRSHLSYRAEMSMFLGTNYRGQKE